MKRYLPHLLLLSIFIPGSSSTTGDSQVWQSTRVPPSGYVFGDYDELATKTPYVLAEMDLKPGDVVVDVGGGKGGFTAEMAGRSDVEAPSWRAGAVTGEEHRAVRGRP